MYGRRKSRIEKIVRKWGVFMSAMLKQKLIDIANGFTKYGLWKGGGSGALSDMTDVTFTNLQTNDVLTYNGSKWVNDDNLQTQINTLNSNFTKYKNSIYNMDDIKITRFNIEAGRMVIEFFDTDGNSYAFRVGISSKELIVDSIINGVFSRNKIL